MLRSSEGRHYRSLISTAERRLAQMVAEIAALPKEAAGTRLETLGIEIIQAMEWKVQKLRANYQSLREYADIDIKKAVE